MQITIKNTKSGHLKTFNADDLDAFQNVLTQLRDYSLESAAHSSFELDLIAINEIINSFHLAKLKAFSEKHHIDYLKIYSNNRETILTGKSLKINSKFVSEKKLKNKLFFNITKKQEDVLHKGTIRSGDRISSKGDLFIFGDVNPGAQVSATNNVFVWGKLLGIASAGEGGNTNSSIASLYLNPLQLRIADFVAIGPKEKPKNAYPEIAVLDKKSIIIKPYIIDTQK